MTLKRPNPGYVVDSPEISMLNILLYTILCSSAALQSVPKLIDTMNFVSFMKLTAQTPGVQLRVENQSFFHNLAIENS